MRTAIYVFLATAYVMLGHQYAAVWMSDLTLWERAVAMAPLKIRPHNNYAKVLYGLGRDAEAQHEIVVVAMLERIARR